MTRRAVAAAPGAAAWPAAEVGSREVAGLRSPVNVSSVILDLRKKIWKMV